MACLKADVLLECRRANGSIFLCQKGKNASLELEQISTSGVVRVLVILANKQGKLTMELQLVKFHSSEAPMTVTVMISNADPEELSTFRETMDVLMSKTIIRKPLQPISSNLSNSGQHPLKRKASSSVTGISNSCRSNSSWVSCAPAVTSKPQSFEVMEQLAPLSAEQQKIVDVVQAGKNVFFTGCAGTGKSLVLKHILRILPAGSTFVTASTGLAACALGGMTLHAFSGVGRCSDLQSARKLVFGRRETLHRWRRATTLIIDEISMVGGEFFDLVEAVAREVRGRPLPFGGLQLVLCGDFHQLPPVAVTKGVTKGGRRFAFQSSAWPTTVHCCLHLIQVFRQEDAEFVEMLAKIREGKGACVVPELLERCSRPLLLSGIQATKLFTHRADVDELNRSELEKLPGDPVELLARDSGTAPHALETGCSVMLLRNISAGKGLVNGARGVVQRFADAPHNTPIVRFGNGEDVTIHKEKWTIAMGQKIIATRVQVPLELAWAISVHKCQGLTLDAVQINLLQAFESGMAYVALRSLEGLQIVGGINPRALRADSEMRAQFDPALLKVTEFYQRLALHEEMNLTRPSQIKLHRGNFE